MRPTTVAVIPARYPGRRLPGKVLLDLAGLPMIQHVYRRACAVDGLDSVFVATDDDRIQAVVEGFGGRVVRTRSDHKSGTDRVLEAVAGLDAELVVNIQGDEPLLEPSTVEAVLAAFDDPQVQVATPAAPLSGDVNDPAVVKVVVDRADFALYFSRAPIPTGGAALAHIGLYAFRRAALERFGGRAPGPLERAERLEQLRFLEYGDRVRIVRVGSAPPSVDTEDDLNRVRRILASSATPGG